MIKNVTKVIEHFGYWPEFCDAKIKSFSNDSGVINITIDYIDSDQSKSALIDLKFSDVSQVELSELKSENVIDLLKISGNEPYEVVIEPCYGLGGAFKCSTIEVCGVNA